MPIKQALTNQRVPVKIWTASSLDGVTRNRCFLSMIFAMIITSNLLKT